MLLNRIFTRTLLRSARLSAAESGVPQQQQQQQQEQEPVQHKPDEPQPDELHRYLWLKCQAYETATLDSYEQFVKSAANHLDIEHVKTEQPWRTIRRRTLLASRFVHKKYRVQYETRSYYRDICFKNLTGSTADTFLEYVERNLPPGVLMIVEKHTLNELPFELQQE